MEEFQTCGGLLDGILAVTHPELYRQALAVSEEVFRTFGACRGQLSLWPSCFSSVQVIVNRSSPIHRDLSGYHGWLELLLTLGTYGETAILELRNLGVSVPYPPGSVAMLCSRQILHGVPTVAGDRICYAWYMNKQLFRKVDAEYPGKAIVPELEDEEVDDNDADADGSESDRLEDGGDASGA